MRTKYRSSRATVEMTQSRLGEYDSIYHASCGYARQPRYPKGNPY